MYLVVFLLGFASGALSVVIWALRVYEAREREKRKRESAGDPWKPPTHPMCRCSIKPFLKGDDADGQDDSE